MNSSTAVMVALLNTFLFVDLYLIIVNPFFERHKRARFYFFITAVMTLVIAIF